MSYLTAVNYKQLSNRNILYYFFREKATRPNQMNVGADQMNRRSALEQFFVNFSAVDIRQINAASDEKLNQWRVTFRNSS